MTAEVTYEGWRDVPIGYLMLDRDQAFPLWLQKQWAELIEKDTGRTVSMRHMDAAHCANVTAPEKIAEMIRDLVNSLVD